MALWTGLGQAATVAQLVGADVGGLISMIMQAALTARQNRSECEQLARRALMIAQLLPHVQDPEAARPLAGLGDTLRDAHELVVSCQGRSAAYQFVMAGRTAERFREVQSNIDFYLILFPVISHIGITRRLERIYNVLVPDDSTRVEPSPQLQDFTEVSQEVLAHRTHEFRLAEIMAATNNFALDTVIGCGGSGTVYRGRLHDGREVAVKRIDKQQSHFLGEVFHRELDILSRLRHKHIIRLLGSCVGKDKRFLTKRGKEPEEPERLIVYEYMENNTLYHQLHSHRGSSTLSPVTVSWKMRIDVLLGVSRAIEHLHCHANPPIIHHDLKSSNILFDASWVPHLSDFGSSVVWDIASEETGLDVPVTGTFGYLEPEYCLTGRLKLASEVYSLGVLMLEVLTGKRAFSQREETNVTLACFALPIIEAGNLGELLDRRPVPQPTSGELEALEHVAQTAVCCLKLDGKGRPAISHIVANLEMACELIRREEPGAVDESGLVDELDEPSSVDELDEVGSFEESGSVDESGSVIELNETGSADELNEPRSVDLKEPGSVDKLNEPGSVDKLNEPGSGEPSPIPPLYELQGSPDVAQEIQILPHRIQEFKFAEIVAATNNFADVAVIGSGRYGPVYRGRLHDGREVAVKRMMSLQSDDVQEEFRTELDIISRLRHKHIVRLLGSCVSKDRRLLTWRRKEQERLIVYEYMKNGTLFDHLHPDQGSSVLSPVMVSWKMRIDVLVGVSRAIEHLHYHANPPIIHHDIKSSNILFDADWVPRLSDFGSSVAFHMASEDSVLVPNVTGTFGYLDPEYYHTHHLKPTSDVYNFGVVILEVLTGKKAYSQGEGMDVAVTSFALPIIEAGNLGELLDRRPTPQPTVGQLEALEYVAQTALCCLKLDGKDRPSISGIVAYLEMAHELIHREESGSVDESPYSPHARWSVSSAGSQSDMESEELEEGR